MSFFKILKMPSNLKSTLNLNYIWLPLRFKFNNTKMKEIILKRSMEWAYMKVSVRKKNFLNE